MARSVRELMQAVLDEAAAHRRRNGRAAEPVPARRL